MRDLLTPKWVIAHVGVLIIAVTFVNLGFWQLRRLEERRLDNAVVASRYAAPVEDLSVLIEAAGGDFESLRYRRASVTGVYDTDHEVLTRNQVFQDQAGFHVVDPLIVQSGEAVLVNRGWVPLALDTTPVGEAAPPDGELMVTGWIETTQVRPALGPTDPSDGVLDVMSRIDIVRIEQQTPYDLAPVYLVAEGERSDTLPVPLAEPRFDDEGSHLAYAIQWFGFTVIGIVGYFFIVRKQLSRSA